MPETEVARFSLRKMDKKTINVEKRRDGMLMVKIPSAGIQQFGSSANEGSWNGGSRDIFSAIRAR